AQSSSAANPFTQAGIPSLSDLPICNTECAPVAQIQTSWNGDYSAACTTSFANSLATCMACVANSAIGQAVLTPQTQQQVAQALQGYEDSCRQAGSPVTLNISSILAPTSSGSSGSAGTTPSMTAAPSSSSTPNGGVTRVEFGAGAFIGVAAFVAGTLF
ncbi:hypothetical protein M408DRAFT_78199, partial [Serendipita vermifera MAFF 305830]